VNIFQREELRPLVQSSKRCAPSRDLLSFNRLIGVSERRPSTHANYIWPRLTDTMKYDAFAVLVFFMPCNWFDAL
jgi:hypothetical protein